MLQQRFLDLTLYDENKSENVLLSLCTAACNLVGIVDKKNEFLSDSENSYFIHLNNDLRKLDFLLGTYAAKSAILNIYPQANLHNISIKNGVFGFPYLEYEDSCLDISITHSNGFAASVAFDKAYPMGIDSEVIDKKRLDTIQSILTACEINLAQESNLEEEVFLFILWTAKEALAKAIRTGLLIEPKILEISKVYQLGSMVHVQYKNFECFSCISNLNENIVLSLAIPSKLSISQNNFWKS